MNLCVSIILTAAVAGISHTVTAAPFPTQVQAQSGALLGVADDGVLSFRGIPFAQSPVGELRWRPPQPIAAWTGVRPADRYGHDCMQVPFPFDAAPPAAPFSEDCLVLNVWRPARTTDKLPVIVWIYGGGFVIGGTSPAVYDGRQFARRDVVFVSFNYRLGRFGFFAFPALSREHPNEPLGNYGYMDQIAALEWVQHNIAAFGGDPGNVTVFGESAGGGSVHMLMTSPMARGLFAKAIVESGGGRGSLVGPRRLHEDAPNLPSAETVGVNFAHSVGIEGNGPDALARLRALPADKVLANVGLTNRDPSIAATYSGPMLDGKVAVEDPGHAYLAGREAKVPFMIGANSADIGFSAAKSIDKLFAPFGADRYKALAAYDPEHSGDLRTVAARVGMDRAMVEPARFVAATLAAQGLPTFEYRFSYVADSKRGEFKAGAPHASEVPYVFDTVSVAYGKALSPRDEALAQAMNGYWVNFARTGDPNGQGLPHWPSYSKSKDMIMDFSAEGIPVAEADPWKPRLDIAARQAENPSH